jgi:hypothetical protein
LSDSCSNSDDGQVSANVGGGDGGNDDSGGCRGDYNDKNEDNKHWALWDNNNHDSYMIIFHASSGYKPPQNVQMPVFMHKVFMLFLAQLYFMKWLLKLTDM